MQKTEDSDTTLAAPVQSFSRQYPAIVHAAIVSAFVLPLTLVPYLIARRQIHRFRQTVRQLERKTTVLQSALDLTADSHNLMKGEVKRLQDLSRNALEATTVLRKEVTKQNTERRRVDEAITTDLRRLLEESQHGRFPIHTLGTSLADIAAFMQEVELDFGMNPMHGEDRHGIERLRDLARQLQNLPEEAARLDEEDETEGDSFTSWR